MKSLRSFESLREASESRWHTGLSGGLKAQSASANSTRTPAKGFSVCRRKASSLGCC